MIFSRTDRVQIEQDNFCPLGLTLCRDGQIERGADELRKALALNPEDRGAAKASRQSRNNRRLVRWVLGGGRQASQR